MRKITLPIVVLLLFSCSHQNNEMILEGIYQDVNDNTSRTIINKISENKYEIIAEFDQSLRFTVTRAGNILTGNFQGKPQSIEFNATYDTIFNKSSGKIMFTAFKVSK